jgi:hypothetical protein
MTNKKFPIVCPKCKSTNLREIAERIYQTLRYIYVGPDTVSYHQIDDDSENFGDACLQCDKCEYRYEDSVYAAFLECV